MNKTELIEAIATRSNTTKTQTATMLDGLIEVVQKTLASGNNVQLVGFGTFSVTERASREGRNPATGETMTIPAKKVVKFKLGKTLAYAAAAKPTLAAKSKKTAKKKKTRLGELYLGVLPGNRQGRGEIPWKKVHE